MTLTIHYLLFAILDRFISTPYNECQFFTAKQDEGISTKSPIMPRFQQRFVCCFSMSISRLDNRSINLSMFDFFCNLNKIKYDIIRNVILSHEILNFSHCNIVNLRSI